MPNHHANKSTDFSQTLLMQKRKLKLITEFCTSSLLHQIPTFEGKLNMHDSRWTKDIHHMLSISRLIYEYPFQPSSVLTDDARRQD
jgi:hypothetical protein